MKRHAIESNSAASGLDRAATGPIEAALATGWAANCPIQPAIALTRSAIGPSWPAIEAKWANVEPDWSKIGLVERMNCLKWATVCLMETNRGLPDPKRG